MTKEMWPRLLDVLDLYGGTDIYNLPIDARTGRISNVIEDFEEKFAEAVETLKLSTALQNLKAANERFLQCQSDRDLSDADFGKRAMLDARNATDKIWRALVETVNNTIAYGTEEQSEALVPFVRYMNVEIDKYRVQNGQGVGGNWGSGSSSSTGSEETVNLKNATFVYANGVEVKLKVEVGTVVVAPDNTPGYYWPDLPEFMPKRSFTVREVPIEEDSENSESSELDPAENIKIVFKNQYNQPVHEVIVPVDYQMTEEEYPTPPEGTHWNFTLADLNLAIGMKNPGDTITVRAQANG